MTTKIIKIGCDSCPKTRPEIYVPIGRKRSRSGNYDRSSFFYGFTYGLDTVPGVALLESESDGVIPVVESEKSRAPTARSNWSRATL